MKSGVSLQQMLTEVKRQSESKEDYLIAPNRLRMESYESPAKSKRSPA